MPRLQTEQQLERLGSPLGMVAYAGPVGDGGPPPQGDVGPPHRPEEVEQSRHILGGVVESDSTIAAAATVVLTSLYAISALSNKLRAGVLCAILTTLYGLLYVILNSEDYALLIGSSLLFAALAGTMYFTRKIDWYRVTEQATG